jgi:transcription elongation factor SPT4
MKACKQCHLITETEVCPRPGCGGELSRDWQGYVVILDYSRSVIAEKMNITFNGSYALKVR